jgi:hypothetical protein
MIQSEPVPGQKKKKYTTSTKNQMQAVASYRPNNPKLTKTTETGLHNIKMETKYASDQMQHSIKLERSDEPNANQNRKDDDAVNKTTDSNEHTKCKLRWYMNK